MPEKTQGALVGAPIPRGITGTLIPPVKCYPGSLWVGEGASFIAAGQVSPSRSALQAAHCLHPQGPRALLWEYHSPPFKKEPHAVKLNHR